MTASKWRPMETAPRDGTKVLLAVEWNGKASIMMAWCHGRPKTWLTGAYPIRFDRPAAWQPLPTYDHERDKP